MKKRILAIISASVLITALLTLPASAKIWYGSIHLDVNSASAKLLVEGTDGRHVIYRNQTTHCFNGCTGFLIGSGYKILHFNGPTWVALAHGGTTNVNPVKCSTCH